MPRDKKADPKGNRTKADLAAREPLTPLPQEAVEVPAPPDGLSDSTLSLWEGLWRSPVARVLDLDADIGVARRWIKAVEEMDRASRILEREGVTVIGSSGTPVMSPTANWVKHLEGVIGRLERELGLTPMSRARLGLTIAAGELTAAQINAMAEGRDPGDGHLVVDVEALDDEDLWEEE